MQQSIADELRGAASLISARRFSDARRVLVDALGQDPQNARAYVLLASCLTSLGEHPAAIQAAQNAIGITPQAPTAHYQLGVAYFHAKRLRDAQYAFEAAVALRPDHANFHLALSNALAAQRLYARAFEEIERTIALDPNVAEAWSFKGLILTDLGRKEEAKAAAARALMLAPNSAGAHLAEGFSALTTMRPGDAVKAFREVLRLDPTNAQARRGYAAAARMALPFFRPIFSKSKKTKGILVGGLLGFVLLLFFLTGNPFTAAAWAFAIVVLGFLALHLIGTVVIHRDRLIRHILRREEYVPAYWFFGSLIVAVLLGVAGLLLRSVGIGWIAATCAVAALVTALYAIPAALPEGAPASYRVQRLIAWFGLFMTGVTEALGIAFGITLMTIKHPSALGNLILSALFEMALIAAFTLVLFLIVSVLFNLMRSARRSAVKRAIRA
ncbi:MAG TPA: tetratricopeptide repeat protein [Candidatus Cybelea sp.]|nr:tetratricopeptide repeat protein [Candidatus Cybelea sp.]